MEETIMMIGGEKEGDSVDICKYTEKVAEILLQLFSLLAIYMLRNQDLKNYRLT